MEYIGTLFELTKNLMDTQLTLYGFTFSYWQIFIWTMIAGLILWFLGKVFLND
ncbi:MULTISPECIES: hypothetical protein [unclassified Oscillibacter]|uniref:hypothetical protein n=1 Tax=unclassified Oscillibacter TaxID=2629304 RepID=UPI0025F495DD|nr:MULTISPECIES: hypothetical protein [unclassified Oscillibacter]